MPTPTQRFEIRPISAADAAPLCAIIRQVGREFGAIGEGFGPSDPEVEALHRYYGQDGRSQYWVALLDGHLVGGGGIAPLDAAGKTCELKKLFLLPQARGLGIGRQLCQEGLAFAQAVGYRQCYLDTLRSMTAAIALYQQLGFQHLDAPLDTSIHGGCDVWMLKTFNCC
ncbi:MAG TPA: GNAT family N-acetyltransferase [Motiliproteus sp.]